MDEVVRIGTRESQLAVWQATEVSRILSDNGITTELVFIKSEGDLNLTTPLYEMGVQGIFTRELDSALLEGRIDLAVHSMKDVPVVPAKGIEQVAVLTRASYQDLLVLKPELYAAYGNDLDALYAAFDGNLIIATSSVRRKAQWLHRYPRTQMENLRGNVNTRLQKLLAGNWHGAIFAAAGLERIQLRPAYSFPLDWMLPAPAQGAIMVVCQKGDARMKDICTSLNDTATALCVEVEREFLRLLQGGCTTPISAWATLEGENIVLSCNITATDGSESIRVQKKDLITAHKEIAASAAEEILKKGGAKFITR